jgi:hypothetical protein
VIGLRLAVCADIIILSLADGEDRGRDSQSDCAQWKAAPQSLGQPVARDWLGARDSRFVLPAVVVEDRDGTARWAMCRDDQQRTGTDKQDAKLLNLLCRSFYSVCKGPQGPNPILHCVTVNQEVVHIQYYV